jgi:NADH dehydrogenase
MKRIVIVGGGFAGLACAIGAARKLDELGVGSDEVRLTLINRDAWHSIRVRNYERDLSDVRIPLDTVLGPIGVERVEGEVCAVDLTGRRLSLRSVGNSAVDLAFDRLVLAAGSRLNAPDLPGLREYCFDVDTYDAAARLNAHVAGLRARPVGPGRFTALVVGAGLTGVEVACEMPEKLRAAASGVVGAEPIRVILADHVSHVGSDMGESARPVIELALAALGVETRVEVRVAAIDERGVSLDNGERILADTVVWAAGMRANPLAALIGPQCDRFGRIPVDEALKVRGIDGVFAAGDMAVMAIDGRHPSVMSCQHARPMGRFAGHNVVCDLMELPMLPLRVDWYVTCLDLGAWGAVYTEGWERRVTASGTEAKRTKRTINCVRIYPPRSGDRREILEWGAPEITPPPRARS